MCTYYIHRGLPCVMYYTSPGPILHVDPQYEVRNQILDLCHVLWADLC